MTQPTNESADTTAIDPLDLAASLLADELDRGAPTDGGLEVDRDALARRAAQFRGLGELVRAEFGPAASLPTDLAVDTAEQDLAVHAALSAFRTDPSTVSAQDRWPESTSDDPEVSSDRGTSTVTAAPVHVLDDRRSAKRRWALRGAAAAAAIAAVVALSPRWTGHDKLGETAATGPEKVLVPRNDTAISAERSVSADAPSTTIAITTNDAGASTARALDAEPTQQPAEQGAAPQSDTATATGRIPTDSLPPFIRRIYERIGCGDAATAGPFCP